MKFTITLHPVSLLVGAAVLGAALCLLGATAPVPGTSATSQSEVAVAGSNQLKQSQPALLTVAAVMSVEEVTECGLAKLSTAERTRLDAWLQRYTSAVRSRATVEKIGGEQTWPRGMVTPVVLVEPGVYGGYIPMDGTGLGDTWRKTEVKPVLLVRPGAFGFEPLFGSSLFEHWDRKDLAPVVFVEPGRDGFVCPAPAVPAMNANGESATPQVIESHIDGDFEGWDGETVVKLENGQVWQQMDLSLSARFALRPEVIIYESRGQYRIKVSGDRKSVAVRRLR